VFIGCWDMTEQWRGLDRRARERELAEMRRRVEPLLARNTIRCLGWARNDKSVDPSTAATQKLFCIWTADTKDGIHAFARAEHEIGWYAYAAQVNFAGQLESFETMASHLTAQG